MSRSDTPTTKVYVGNLPDDAKKEELEREFERYGKLHDVWVARNPPGFAFVEFYDSRDAKDAVNDLDGQRLCGAVVKVELSHGRGRSSSRGGGGGRGRSSRDRYGGSRDRDGYDRRDGGYDRRGSRNRSGSPMYRRRSPVQQQRGWKDRSRSRSRSPPARF